MGQKFKIKRIELIIFTFIIFSLVSYRSFSNNIGVCSGKYFLDREKMLDRLILQLKKSVSKKQKRQIHQRIINNFGYIGIENLIRYREKELVPIFVFLLNHSDFYVKYKALYALRYFKDRSPDVILNLMLKFLDSKNIILKEMAISTLTEIGNKSILNYLTSDLSKTTNFFIKNSLKFAIKKIKNDLKPTFPNFPYSIYTTNNLTKYRYYKSGEKIKNYKETFSKIFLKSVDMPIADKFSPPILSYWNEVFVFKGKRFSFNVGTDIKRHVGDDCGWFREGTSVFAIGNGIVRLIHHSPDWGFLIVVEHKLIDGTYICSLYGHLSREIYVKEGDIVKRGDKIGTIGLSYSIENGGYGAHLHFGISKGPFFKSRYQNINNVAIIYNNKKREVKRYELTEKGIAVIFDGNIKVNLEEIPAEKNLQDYLFWIKGYEFTKDVERLWLNPQEFLLRYK